MRVRKISMVWSSARSPRSSRVLAISKRFSTIIVTSSNTRDNNHMIGTFRN